MPAPVCPYCQRTMIKRHPSLQPTRDHVVPRSLGGRATVICCLDCNGIKADLLPLAWSAFMLANPEWWRLPRNEIRRRKRLLVVAEDTPPLSVPAPMRRALQGEAPLPPVIVPPELIWNDEGRPPRGTWERPSKQTPVSQMAEAEASPQSGTTGLKLPVGLPRFRESVGPTLTTLRQQPSVTSGGQSKVSEFVEEGLHAPPGVVADDPDVVGLGSNCGLQAIALLEAAIDPDNRQDDDHGIPGGG